MPVLSGCAPADIGVFLFKWLPFGMNYLGIRLTTDFQDYMTINPVLQNIKTSQVENAEFITVGENKHS